MRWRLVLGVWVVAFALVRSAPAVAHAILVESAPALGAVVPPGEVTLRLRFNSRIDRARSRVILIREDRSTSVVPIDVEGSDDIILVHPRLSSGSYVIRWQVLAVDGHITRGDVPLTVRAAGN